MELPKLLFSGDWEPNNIEITHSPSRRKIDPELEAEIQQSWDQLVENARANNKKAWDSELYRLEEFQIDGERLLIDLSMVRFSEAKGMNKLVEEINALGEEYFSKGIFVTGMILTSDGYYVFGRNSSSGLNSQEVTSVGGVLSKDEMEVKDSNDLIGFQYLEMMEEMGIGEGFVTRASLRCGILSATFRVGLVFGLHLNIDWVEVEERFNSQNNDELSGLFFVHWSEVNEFLMKQEGYLRVMGEVDWN